MTDTNQKLREAFESRMTDNGKWPNAIKQGRNGCYLLAQTENAWTEWQACAEALALPTADHLPDAGEMVVDHFPDATKMIETAAPVGELPELPEPFALSVSVHDGEHCKWPLVECMLYQKHPNEKQNLYTADQMRAYARAALSAGDAVDAQRLDFIEKSARCDPKMDGQHVWWPTSFNTAQLLKGPTLREAIDNAIRARKDNT